MAQGPDEKMDPENIDEQDFPEASSVAFFEARLFLRGTFEDTFDLLRGVKNLLRGTGPTGAKGVPTWVVQGAGDAVCPEKYARDLVKELEDAGVLQSSWFVHAGHKASEGGISGALRTCVREFASLAAEAGT